MHCAGGFCAQRDRSVPPFTKLGFSLVFRSSVAKDGGQSTYGKSTEGVYPTLVFVGLKWEGRKKQ
jgi:hypothetical protein